MLRALCTFLAGSLRLVEMCALQYRLPCQGPIRKQHPGHTPTQLSCTEALQQNLPTPSALAQMLTSSTVSILIVTFAAARAAACGMESSGAAPVRRVPAAGI